jgi:hypothetical protein
MTKTTAVPSRIETAITFSSPPDHRLENGETASPIRRLCDRSTPKIPKRADFRKAVFRNGVWSVDARAPRAEEVGADIADRMEATAGLIRQSYGTKTATYLRTPRV